MLNTCFKNMLNTIWTYCSNTCWIYVALFLCSTHVESNVFNMCSTHVQQICYIFPCCFDFKAADIFVADISDFSNVRDDDVTQNSYEGGVIECSDISYKPCKFNISSTQ